MSRVADAAERERPGKGEGGGGEERGGGGWRSGRCQVHKAPENAEIM